MKLSISESDYLDWKKKFLSKYSKYCLAIYELGNISYPGLSDIDILVIPNTKKGGFITFDVMKDKELNKLPFCLHNPFVVPYAVVTVLENVNFDNLKQIYGPVLELPKYIPNIERELLQFIEGAYSLIDFSDALDVRPNEELTRIPVMSSLRFTLKYLDDINSSSNAILYSQKFDIFRKDYLLGVENYSEMKSLFAQYLEVVKAFIVDKNISRSHYENLLIYRNMGLDIRVVLKILASKMDYINFLEAGNYDYGSVLRSSFYPLKKLGVSKRLYRKVVWATR
jgi:hypothetical protein